MSSWPVAVVLLPLCLVLAAAGFTVVASAPGPRVGVAGFTLLGFGVRVIVPQTFAGAGQMFPGASEEAIARLIIFHSVGFLVGSPLVGAIGDAWNYCGAMLVPMVLFLPTLLYARSSGTGDGRYGGGYEQPRTVDVGRRSNEV